MPGSGTTPTQMVTASSVPVDSPSTAANPLEEYEPASYWALWQHPENRYCYFMDGDGQQGWLLTFEFEELAQVYLPMDAHENGRPFSAYRIDELTLPEAFDAVRAQPVPFMTSLGTPIVKVHGVVIWGIGGFKFIRL